MKFNFFGGILTKKEYIKKQVFNNSITEESQLINYSSTLGGFVSI